MAHLDTLYRIMPGTGFLSCSRHFCFFTFSCKRTRINRLPKYQPMCCLSLWTCFFNSKYQTKQSTEQPGAFYHNNFHLACTSIPRNLSTPDQSDPACAKDKREQKDHYARRKQARTQETRCKRKNAGSTPAASATPSHHLTPPVAFDREPFPGLYSIIYKRRIFVPTFLIQSKLGLLILLPMQ